jgi:hypothetical protein
MSNPGGESRDWLLDRYIDQNAPGAMRRSARPVSWRSRGGDLVLEKLIQWFLGIYLGSSTPSKPRGARLRQDRTGERGRVTRDHRRVRKATITSIN